MLQVRAAFIFVVLSALAPPAKAEGDMVVRLTSLEWAPYTGRELPGQGLSSGIVRRAFAAAGYSVAIDFVPWRRALSLGLDGSQGHDGVFPVYIERAERECVSSAAIGVSPVGFAERRSAAVSWTTLADLKGLRIGVVSGYRNTPEFDAMAASGELTVEAVDRELLNLRRLAHGRLDLAVIDSLVFTFLSAGASNLRQSLRMNGRLLMEKPLFVCFRPTAADRAAVLRDALNAGLAGLAIPPAQEPPRR